jgi:hypothetical protein
MTAQILYPAAFRRAQADATDRVIDAGNRFLAERLGLIPVRAGGRYVPIPGAIGERDVGALPQLEDGE